MSMTIKMGKLYEQKGQFLSISFNVSCWSDKFQSVSLYMPPPPPPPPPQMFRTVKSAINKRSSLQAKCLELSHHYPANNSIGKANAGTQKSRGKNTQLQ